MRSSVILGSLAGALLVAWSSSASAQAPRWCATQSSKNPAERTICATRSLWTLDGQLNSVYSAAENRVGSQKRQLESSQADWLKETRNACGTNVGCLTNAYKARISTLEDIKNRGRM